MTEWIDTPTKEFSRFKQYKIHHGPAYDWSIGSTCMPYTEVAYDPGGPFVILKHQGHSSYLGGIGNRTVRCNTHWTLHYRGDNFWHSKHSRDIHQGRATMDDRADMIRTLEHAAMLLDATWGNT